MWTSFSQDLITALVLMVVAAFLGGLFVWLWLRNRQTQAEAALRNCIQSLEAEAAQLSRDLSNCQKLSTLASTPLPEPTLTQAPEPHAENDEATTLARIQARAVELDFGRIGIASFDNRDDLKVIKGIGPFIEKKLNSIGIYTYRQIANFTLELEDKVNDIIEFFPGRIRRDEWVRQAEALATQKEEISTSPEG